MLGPATIYTHTHVYIIYVSVCRVPNSCCLVVAILLDVSPGCESYLSLSLFFFLFDMLHYSTSIYFIFLFSLFPETCPAYSFRPAALNANGFDGGRASVMLYL